MEEKRNTDESRLPEIFMEYMAGDRGCSPATLVSYESSLRSFRKYFTSLDEQLTWLTVDSDVVRRWMAWMMKNGINARTVKKSLSALRSFYKYLILTGHAATDPMLKVQNPKVSAPLPAFFKQTEMDRLFDNVKFPADFTGMRDRLMLLTFYTTGLRISELIGMDREDVSEKSGELKVTGKRNKQRIVPFGKELREAMLAYIPRRDEIVGKNTGAFFIDSKGKRISPDKVRRCVKKYMSMVTTQKKRTPHVLRHTFATVMLNNGADLEAVRELLGHESLSTTEIYTHTSFTELRKVYENAHPRSNARGESKEKESGKNANPAS